MTPEEIARRLRPCSFSVASFDKRFVREVNAGLDAGKPLSEKQAALVRKMGHRYRRQLGTCLDPGCVECAKVDTRAVS